MNSARSWSAGRRGESCAILLGVLCVAGFAPFRIAVLPPLSLALLFVLWRDAATPRRAAWLGWLWGFGCFLGGVSWVYVSMHDVGGMPAPLAALATVLFCAALALYPALAGGLFGRWRTGTAARDAALVAGLWLLAEWLRGWVLSGFPWLAVGYSQSPPSPLAGYAAILGVYGVGFVVALLAGIAAFSRDAGSLRRGVLTAVALCAAGWLIGSGARWTQPVGASLTVSLLQGNIEQRTKWNRERLRNSLETYARLVREHPAQLAVLPETALPMFLDDVPPQYIAELTRSSPVLAGVAVTTRRPGSDGNVDGYANAAVALETGRLPQAYAKSHLVPFGEFVPAGFSWILTLMRVPMSDFTPGPAIQAPLDLSGQKVAPNICYEDLFGEEILRALPQATLLVNLSNTAWFGDSLAQPQHLQIAQMRALETGRVMLRATNTGMTAAIGPDGRILAALPPFAEGGLTVTVQGRAGLTPYARWGNLPAIVLALAALLPASAWLRRQNSAAPAPNIDSA